MDREPEAAWLRPVLDPGLGLEGLQQGGREHAHHWQDGQQRPEAVGPRRHGAAPDVRAVQLRIQAAGDSPSWPESGRTFARSTTHSSTTALSCADSLARTSSKK